MTGEPVDLSVKIDQEEFDLLKDNVEFGKPSESFELLTSDVISNSEYLKNFITNYVESKPNELIPLFYELIQAYLEKSPLLESHKIVDTILSILNFDIKLKNSRISDFLILCNSFPISSNIKALIQSLKFPTDVMITNLGTAMLMKLSIFTAQDYKASLAKKVFQYENYQLNNEDSIGYSIIVVQLYNIFNDEFADYKVDQCADFLIKCIGFYKLDPIRVFDVIFDVYSNNIMRNYKFAIRLLQKSPFWPDEEHKLDYDDLFGNLNQGGNLKAMQCISMKLFYQDSRPLSETQKVLIGILIKEGFLNLGHLFNFLKPFKDEDMSLIETLHKEKIAEKIASASELAMAAPLDDSDDESSEKRKKADAAAKSKAKDLKDQVDFKLNLKVTILKSCLSVGLYNESIFILAQYPYLIKCDDTVSILANRFMDAMIEPLYLTTVPLNGTELSIFQQPKLVATTRSSSVHNTVNLKEFPVTHVLTFDATTESYSSKKFHFFYDWKQNLPKVSNLDEFFKVSNEFFSFVGSDIVKNSSLMEKMCHILAKFDDKDKSLEYYRKFIFPYISFIDNNPTLVQCCFAFLKKYDMETRYNIYGEFYQSMYIKNQEEIQTQYKKIEKETNSSLKRLTLQTAKSICRKLSKLVMSSPMVVIIKILESLESYDNLIDLIVDHLAPFFNEYAWDVLPMALLIRLTKPGRSAVQEDGLNERQWLQSISNFIGKISRNTQMNLKPILIYSLKKLNNGEINESIVLKDLLSLVTGIKPISNLTLEQIELLSSEKSLRRVAFNILQDERLASAKPAIRLLKELIQTDSLNELFILLSSLSSNYISSTNTNHMKILTQKNDEFESILHLFTDMINEFLKYNDFVKMILPVDQLCSVYNVQPQWSFEIWRKRLSQMIDKTIDQQGAETSTIKSEWNPVLLEIMEPIQNSLPHYDWANLKIGFFVTFWQLSLYDINFSDSFYDEKLTTLESTIKSLQTKLKVSSRDRDVARSELNRIEKEILRNKSVLTLIPVDKLKHSKHHDNVMLRLSEERKHWLLDEVDLSVQVAKFLDHCLLPRSIHSPFDAIFCAKFVFFWHGINDKNAGVTLQILDYLMNKDILNSLILTFTSTQAENFGLFYGAILRHLNEWRLEENFNSSAVGNGSVGLNEISFQKYREGLFEIHQNILNNLKLSLQDPSYTTRSNCLVFLKNLLDVFPLVDEHCESLLDSIDTILKEDDREDLKLASNSLIGRIKSYSLKWVPASEFYEMSEDQLSEYNQRRKLIAKKLQKAENERRAKIAADEEAIRKKNAAAKAAQLAARSKPSSSSDSTGNPYTKLRPSSASTTTSEKPVSGSITPLAPKNNNTPSTPTGPKAAPRPTAPKSQPTPAPVSAPKTAPVVAESRAVEKAEASISRESSLPSSAEDRSRILKAKIEAEKMRIVSSESSASNEKKRFRDVTADTRPVSIKPTGVEEDLMSQRRAKFGINDETKNGNGNGNGNENKKREIDQVSNPDKSSIPEKKQKLEEDSTKSKPLPPPSDPAPPSGPASSTTKERNHQGFDPKRRTRLPPVNSKPNPNAGKYAIGEERGAGSRYGQYRRSYNDRR